MFELLSRDELHEIDLASIETLEKVGIEIRHERALKLFDEAGAEVDYDKRKVKIPEYLVRDSIRKAPSRFTVYGRTLKHQVRYGDGIVFVSGPNSPNLLDLGTDKLRSATLRDTEDGVRLVDALENIERVWPLSTPQDVPVEIQFVYCGWAVLKNTEKPVGCEVGTPEVIRYWIKLASAVRGGEEELKKWPIFVFTIEISSPLQFHEPQVGMLFELSSRGLPAGITSLPITGATGPVTLAGALVQGNAECLAGTVLSQLIKPGAPVLLCIAPAGLDMRTATLISGTPEVALTATAAIQLGRYYGLPTASITAHTDAPVPGVQAGYEKMLTSLPAALAGANEIGVMGNILGDRATSFVQMVIDDEIAGIIKRVIKGFKVSRETLALDEIYNVGTGGSFLARSHTREYFRKEHLILRLSDKMSWEDWQEAGAKEVKDKAKERAKEILKTHYPEPLDTDVQKEFERIMDEAKKELLRKQ